MKTNHITNCTKRIALLTTTGAIAIVPFVTNPSNVEAAPRRTVPNWSNSQKTITGVVTRDLAGDTFELRADNGRIYRVRVGRYDEPRSLDRGDRVRVSGRQNSNIFIANNLEFLRDTSGYNNGGGHNNGGGYNNERRTLTGVVIRDLAGDNFELRADSGRIYRVRVGRYDEPRSLDRGDRVRVTGQLDNNVFVARNLEFLRDSRR